jgi:chromosome partitioning protein
MTPRWASRREILVISDRRSSCSDAMRVIAVANRKGGTGKTTVCVNLASELAARGRRVLVIDLDSQGHCAMGLGLGALSPANRGIHQTLAEGAPSGALEATILPTAVAGVWLAPATPRFEHGRLQAAQDALRVALARPALHERFDLVLIDTPPSLDALLIAGLTAADKLLVPFVPHPLSFDGVRQLARLVFAVVSQHNPTLRILGFLPVMAASHVRQHRALAAQVGQDFGVARMLPAVRMDIRLAEAFGAGRPVRDYAPRSRATEDFHVLAEEVVRRMGIDGDGKMQTSGGPPKGLR